MTIHAYTEPGNSLPAYINISERVSNPGDVIVSVRSSGENNVSTIILSPEQLRGLVADSNKFLEKHAAAPIGDSLTREPSPVVHAKPIMCPRRAENPGGVFKLLDFDHIRDDDTCSYCGSLDPDVLMARIEAGTIFLKGSDKNYKIYVEAIEGTEPLKAIKFYHQHLSEPQMLRFIELWNEKKIKHSLYVMPFFMVPNAASPVV